MLFNVANSFGKSLSCKHSLSLAFFEDTVVLHQFLKGNWDETVDVHSSVERLRHPPKKRPVTIVSVIMDMPMDVKSALIASVPGHHGVVAEGDPVAAVVDLGHELHRGKELGKIDPLYP